MRICPLHARKEMPHDVMNERERDRSQVTRQRYGAQDLFRCRMPKRN